MEVFVGANCLKFKDIEEFSVMHFDLWKVLMVCYCNLIAFHTVYLL